MIPKSYVGQSLYFTIQGTKHVLKSTHPFFHVGLYFLRISPNINNGTCNDYSMFFDSLDAVLRTWCKYGMVYIVAARGIHIRPSNSVSTILSQSAKGRIAVSESWLPVWLPTLRRKEKKEETKREKHSPGTFETRVVPKKTWRETGSKADGQLWLLSSKCICFRQSMRTAVLTCAALCPSFSLSPHQIS